VPVVPREHVLVARREHQQKTADVRALFMAWDPIGVADEPDAWDEYDCMIGPALSRLRRGADAAALREWIAHERGNHFELPADELADAVLADALVAWWGRAARPSADLPMLRPGRGAGQ
jgi:hypothetical protein